MKEVQKPIFIELVDSGIANRFEFEEEEIIEINWRMTMYPDLYYRVLNHELEHEGGRYKFKDFCHDAKSRTPGIFLFMKNHITAWTQIMPIYWSKRHGRFIYDISTIGNWVAIGVIAYSINYLMRLIV